MDIQFNKTKIVATVGPASSSKEKLRELIEAGVDVFRLNFSHGTHEDHLKVVKHVRALNEEMETNVCLLQDLQGPKIRIGKMDGEGVEIVAGQQLIITEQEQVGNAERVSTTYKGMSKDVRPGERILIDDGKLELEVKECRGEEVVTVVVYGGMLKSKKGINLPFTKVSAPSMTEKDLKDVKFGIEHEVAWIALSFVRSAQDVISLRELLAQDGGSRCKVIAKIEKPEAIEDIDAIIAASDALMVARGDLGVETGMEKVPMAQKMIIRKCNQARKPVIVATQMMESMIESPRPTRAETNDVANAVMDGADALMLSAETAAGRYPIEVVESMVRTIASVERQALGIYGKVWPQSSDKVSFLSDSLVSGACALATATGAKAIISMTNSGYTAYQIAAHRPLAHIFIFTNQRPLLNTLNLIWGVRAFYYDKYVTTDDTFDDLRDILVEKGMLGKGDIFINTASMPLAARKRTNSLKISIVD